MGITNLIDSPKFGYGVRLVLLPTPLHGPTVSRQNMFRHFLELAWLHKIDRTYPIVLYTPIKVSRGIWSKWTLYPPLAVLSPIPSTSHTFTVQLPENIPSIFVRNWFRDWYYSLKMSYLWFLIQINQSIENIKIIFYREKNYR